MASLSSGVASSLITIQLSQPASTAVTITVASSLTRSVELLAETAGDNDAMLLYEMDVDGVGRIRVAEHFTVASGKISAFADPRHGRASSCRLSRAPTTNRRQYPTLP